MILADGVHVGRKSSKCQLQGYNTKMSQSIFIPGHVIKPASSDASSIHFQFRLNV